MSEPLDLDAREPMTAEQFAKVRERGPVGYVCDHSDEPLSARTHYGWEYVEGEGYRFLHMPDVVSSHAGPKDYLSSGQRDQRCPRALPVYDVDAPALIAEVERLRFAVELLGSHLQGGAQAFIDALAEAERLRAELAGIRARAHARSEELLAARDRRPHDDRLRRRAYEDSARELRALVAEAVSG